MRSVAVVLGAATVVSSAPRLTNRYADTVVSAHRDAILTAAGAYGVEPRTLAALMWVTSRDQLSPFRDALERIAVGAWQWDEKSNYFLGSPLNISVGVMQVKPVTLQTAAHIRDLSVNDRSHDSAAGQPAWWSGGYKMTREVVVPDRWKWSGDSIRGWSSPIEGPADKPSVVAALLDDRHNIEASALILALYQWQWESADPSWSIRARPDILATLYQIGFEKSRPHASPVSNRFGTRVLEVYNSDWIRATFPSHELTRSTR